MRHGAKKKLCSSEGCTNYAVRKEECAKGMGQRQRSNCAVAKDAQASRA